MYVVFGVVGEQAGESLVRRYALHKSPESRQRKLADHSSPFYMKTDYVKSESRPR